MTHETAEIARGERFMLGRDGFYAVYPYEADIVPPECPPETRGRYEANLRKYTRSVQRGDEKEAAALFSSLYLALANNADWSDIRGSRIPNTVLFFLHEDGEIKPFECDNWCHCLERMTKNIEAGFIEPRKPVVLKRKRFNVMMIR